MKKLVVAILLLSTLTACTERTEFGSCIGAFDEPKPELKYKASTWNIVLGIVFIETLFVPVIVINDGFKCPYDKK